MEIVGFLAVCLMALITYVRGSRWGLVSYAAILALVVAATLVWGDRETLSSAMVGTLLGIPVLIVAVTARRRREAQAAVPVRT